MQKIVASLLLTIFVAGVVPAYADDSADVKALLESMNSRMIQMQDTIDRQNARLAQLEDRVDDAPQVPASGSAPQEGATIEAAQIPDTEWQKGIKDNINEVVPWLKGLKFGGDMRLRYEAFDYMDQNASTGATDRSRNRFRFRLRYGFEKDYGDDWKVGFRMATATSSTTNSIATDNTSSNVTFGNPGYFTYKNIFVDRAYATFTPNGLKDYGPIQGVTIGAGKFDNPFLRYSTPIVWDADVTPEGIYEQVKVKVVNTEETQVDLQGTAGQFITHENSGFETDAQIFGYQGALTVSTYAFNTDTPVDFNFGTSFYDYPNFSQTIGATNNTATSFLRTNTLAMDNPKILDFYPEIQFSLGRWPVTLWGNYVKNIGNFDETRFDHNTIHDSDTAWGLGARLGKLKNKGDWDFHYGYYDIGANSVVAAFNDSDFGGPGGAGFTNRFGHKFGIGWQFTKSATLNWTGMLVSVNDVVGSSVAANALDEDVFRSQLDVAWKF